MDKPYQPPRGPWYRKFQNALRGWKLGVMGQSSFRVHLVATLAIITLAILLKMTIEQWCLLTLCISTVLTAEFFNSSVEHLARSVDDQYNEQLGAALDIAAGAVLVATIGAVLVGGSLLVVQWQALPGN
jgi:diacylglycerol kinase